MALNPRKLGVRALTLLVAGACLVLLILYPPRWVFHIVLAVLGILGASEFQKIATGFGFGIHRTPVVFCLIYGIAVLYVEWLDLAWLPFIVVLMTSLVSLGPRRDVKQKLPQFGMTLVAASYLSFSLVTVAHLFNLQTETAPDLGRHLFLIFVLVVWAGDSCAYLGGSLFGSHKIAPILSPNKSLEGAIANVLGNFGALVLASYTLLPQLNWYHIFFLTPVFGLLGYFGDLVESSWKRGSAIKDSSRLFPGHGGILDRVDSIFLTAPIFYFFIKYVVVNLA